MKNQRWLATYPRWKTTYQHSFNQAELWPGKLQTGSSESEDAAKFREMCRPCIPPTGGPVDVCGNPLPDPCLGMKTTQQVAAISEQVPNVSASSNVSAISHLQPCFPPSRPAPKKAPEICYDSAPEMIQGLGCGCYPYQKTLVAPDLRGTELVAGLPKITHFQTSEVSGPAQDLPQMTQAFQVAPGPPNLPRLTQHYKINDHCPELPARCRCHPRQAAITNPPAMSETYLTFDSSPNFRGNPHSYRVPNWPMASRATEVAPELPRICRCKPHQRILGLDAQYPNGMAIVDPTGPTHPIQLIGEPAHPATCIIKLLCGYLKIPVEHRETGIKSENQVEQFTRFNPTKVLPVIYDKGKYLAEFRTILRYLVNQYGGREFEFLYPADNVKRAEIEKWMDYDASYASTIEKWALPRIFRTAGPAGEAQMEARIREYLEVLTTSLGNKDFLCGNQVTLADLAVYCSLVLLSAAGFDLRSYHMIRCWKSRMDRLVGLKEAFAAFEKMLADLKDRYGEICIC